MTLTFVGPPRGSGGQPNNSSATSPPSKQNLKSWWKGFKNKDKENNGTEAHFLRGFSSHSFFSRHRSGFTRPRLGFTSPRSVFPRRFRSVFTRRPRSVFTCHNQSMFTRRRRPQSISEHSWFGRAPFILGHPRFGRAQSIFTEDRTGHFESNPVSTAFLQATVQEQGQWEQDQHVIDPESAKRHEKNLKTTKRRRVFASIFSCFFSQVSRTEKSSLSGLTGVENRPQGIFGVPLRQSITYANVAISLDENGQSYIYGYVPIVVAKCGVFLKEKATEVEGIFRLNGSEKRIKDLKHIFDSPDRYGKGLVWDGFTVHDAANVLRRYLNDLPEPVVPLDMYEKFRDPLKGATQQAVGDTAAAAQQAAVDGDRPQFLDGFDVQGAIAQYQQLITNLPPLNRQLLVYILDLLAVFAAKADQNRMTSQNLSAIFQPGILSHPSHAMAPEEYRLNQCVLIFLIENQDHFLIGMGGTAADENRPDVTAPPSTPVHLHQALVTRSSSNASAGAESVAKDGQMRRNKSVSSRRSRQSNGAPSPSSPGLVTTPTGGLTRSNTVPSKRSPGMPSGKFTASVSPLTPLVSGATSLAPPAVVEDEVATLNGMEPQGPMQTALAGRSQERLLELSMDSSTPTRERRRPMLFQRSPPADNEGRQPKKLRKKKFASGNASAHSSSGSLPHSAAVSPGAEIMNPMEQLVEQPTPVQETRAEEQADLETSESTPRGSVIPAGSTLQPVGAEGALTTKKSASASLHSSFNEGSDMDQLDETAKAPAVESPEKGALADKKKRWRLSRKKDDMPVLAPLPSPRTALGTHSNGEASSSSVGSGGQKRQSSGTEAPNPDAVGSVENVNKDMKEESKGLSGWIKNRVRGDKKEKEDHFRAKSPQRDGHGKSIEIKQGAEESQPREAEGSQ